METPFETAIASHAAPATEAPTVTAKDPALATRVTLDGENAVSEVVLPEIGTTLETVGSDGTVFVLIIPPNALLFAEELTMTPIARLDGLSFDGGLVGAVDLQPDGLELMESATLEIRPAAAAELDKEIAFRYRGDGAELFLAMVNPDPTKLTLPINHFSGVGVGNGSATDLQRLAASQPTEIRDQIDAFVAELMHEQGLRRITNEAFVELIELAAMRYYESVILPAIDRADGLVDTATLDDLPQIRRALLDHTGWERQLSLLGSELLSAERTALQARVVEIYKRLFARIADLCFEEHSIEAILMLTGLARTLELQGSGSDSVDWSGCLRFEIRFRSRLVSSHSDEDLGGLLIGQLEMVQTLEAKVAGGDIRGPETYTELVFTHPPSDSSCGSRMDYEGNKPSTFSVVRLWWQTEREQAGPDYAGERPYRLRDVRLLYDVGAPEEIFNFCVGGQFPAGPSHHWQSAYRSMHQDEVFVGRPAVLPRPGVPGDKGSPAVAGGHLAAGWELGSGALIATKVYERMLPVGISECDFWPSNAFECSGGETLNWEVTEQTTIEIYHDPITSP